MKTKIMKDRKSGSKTLVVKPTKREQLEYNQAEWLTGHPAPHLAAFRYKLQDSDVELYYDITDTVDLKTYLKAPLGSVQYVGLLSALDEVLAACTKMGYATSCIRCDVENVFLRPDGTPLFVFVPFAGIPSQWDATPIALLQYLGDTRHMTFVVPDDVRHAQALFDYAKRNPVLSLASYRDFLASEFKLAFTHDAASGQLGSKGQTGARATGSASGRGVSAALRTATGGFGAARGAGSFAQVAAAGGQQAPRMAFDPVSLLKNAPSASDVVASQSVADRVRGGVGEYSPTAAPSGMMRQAVMAKVSAPRTAGPCTRAGFGSCSRACFGPCTRACARTAGISARSTRRPWHHHARRHVLGTAPCSPRPRAGRLLSRTPRQLLPLLRCV